MRERLLPVNLILARRSFLLVQMYPEMCSVCNLPLVTDDDKDATQVVALEAGIWGCGHSFHLGCVEKCLHCPECKRPFLPHPVPSTTQDAKAAPAAPHEDSDTDDDDSTETLFGIEIRAPLKTTTWHEVAYISLVVFAITGLVFLFKNAH